MKTATNDSTTKAASHTPGPWEAQRHAGTQSGPFWGVWAGKDDRIAVIDATGPTDEANAKLVAAAPDLLELAQMCATNPTPGRSQLWVNMIQAYAREAIAKATK